MCPHHCRQPLTVTQAPCRRCTATICGLQSSMLGGWEAQRAQRLLGEASPEKYADMTPPTALDAQHRDCRLPASSCTAAGRQAGAACQRAAAHSLLLRPAAGVYALQCSLSLPAVLQTPGLGHATCLPDSMLNLMLQLQMLCQLCSRSSHVWGAGGWTGDTRRRQPPPGGPPERARPRCCPPPRR